MQDEALKNRMARRRKEIGGFVNRLKRRDGTFFVKTMGTE